MLNLITLFLSPKWWSVTSWSSLAKPAFLNVSGKTMELSRSRGAANTIWCSLLAFSSFSGRLRFRAGPGLEEEELELELELLLAMAGSGLGTGSATASWWSAASETTSWWSDSAMIKPETSWLQAALTNTRSPAWGKIWHWKSNHSTLHSWRSLFATSELSVNGCAVPAKLPTRLCLPRKSRCQRRQLQIKNSLDASYSFTEQVKWFEE